VADVPAAFAAAVAEAFARRPGPRFTLFCSGGPTARRCYQQLAARPDPGLDWSLVDLYLGDERYVPADDPDANQLLVRQALLDPLGPTGAAASFSPMPTELTLADCAAAYGETVDAVLEGPGIDLFHLGLGPDGHTASLFPGAPTLAATATEPVLPTVDPSGRNPHPRLTVTLPVIARARLAVFTVSGAEKAEAVARVRAGEDLPATRVTAGSVRWLIDPPALGPESS
jgi:6-phosphogluconolactonase